MMFCRSLFVLLYFFFWPLCCLFFFDIRSLFTPLVSSNSFYITFLFQNCYETDYADCSCMLSRDLSKNVFISNVINKRSIISCLVGTIVGLLSSLGGYYMFLKFCSGMVSSWTPTKWPKRIIPSEYLSRWPRHSEWSIAPIERPGPTNIYRAANENYNLHNRDYTNKPDWQWLFEIISDIY